MILDTREKTFTHPKCEGLARRRRIAKRKQRYGSFQHQLQLSSTAFHVLIAHKQQLARYSSPSFSAFANCFSAVAHRMFNARQLQDSPGDTSTHPRRSSGDVSSHHACLITLTIPACEPYQQLIGWLRESQSSEHQDLADRIEEDIREFPTAVAQDLRIKSVMVCSL